MSKQTQYTYDVFISYSHVQREWVRGQLLPQLEKAGLKVIIDYRDFEIGVPSLVNMERAVDNSRHTLVVLTPAWVASEWTEFESLLVGTTDPAARRRQVILLLLETCKLPPRFAMLTFADFTQPSEHEVQMARLVKSILTQSKGDAAPTTIESDPKPIDGGNTRSTASLTNTTAAGDAAIIPLDGVPADFVLVTTLEEERALLVHLEEQVAVLVNHNAPEVQLMAGEAVVRLLLPDVKALSSEVISQAAQDLLDSLSTHFPIPTPSSWPCWRVSAAGSGGELSTIQLQLRRQCWSAARFH